MSLLSSMFGAGVRVRNTLYDRGRLRSLRLSGPTISVGNLSVGGSGKTPFVILLGELLKQRGIAFDVLSRGYGRRSRGVALVDPAGSARQFGDEPLLISRRLNVPVIVGEDRYSAGIFAEKKFGPQFHLLDDGFQHRRLARDFDIVMLTPEDAQDKLMPAGRLREPMHSLQRADAVVLPSAAAASEFPLDGKLVWRTRRGIRPRDVPPDPVAFCGIARPQTFFLPLRLTGVHVAAEATYRDHHPYTESDVRELLALKERSGAQGFITTEKDEINLGTLRSQLEPLAVVPVEMKLLDSDVAIEAMLAKIAERTKIQPQTKGELSSRSQL